MFQHVLIACGHLQLTLVWMYDAMLRRRTANHAPAQQARDTLQQTLTADQLSIIQ